ncbi:MAG: hypothetical protein WD738_23225 [Pirellulales bacterium]
MLTDTRHLTPAFRSLAGGGFEMTFNPLEFTRLTPDELKEKGAGLKSVVLDDE